MKWILRFTSAITPRFVKRSLTQQVAEIIANHLVRSDRVLSAVNKPAVVAALRAASHQLSTACDDGIVTADELSEAIVALARAAVEAES